MRLWKIVLVALCAWAVVVPDLRAATAKIVKVLPQFLDREGRVALSPSLYDRDAYQAELRAHPERQGGLNFAVQWKSSARTPLTLRIELRGFRGNKSTTAMIETSERHRGLFSKWSTVVLTGRDFREFGEVIAWRATLWEGNKLLAEQTSFLW